MKIKIQTESRSNYRGEIRTNDMVSAFNCLGLILTCLAFTACSSKLPSDAGSGAAANNSTAAAPSGNSPSSVNTQPGGTTQSTSARACAGDASATYIQQSTGFYPGAQTFFTNLGSNWQSWADFASTCNANVNTAVTTLTAQGWPCDGVANTANYVTACVDPLKRALCVAGNTAFCTN